MAETTQSFSIFNTILILLVGFLLIAILFSILIADFPIGFLSNLIPF